MKVLIPFLGWLFVASIGVDIIEFMWGKAPEFTSYLIVLLIGGTIAWIAARLFSRFRKTEKSVMLITDKLDVHAKEIHDLNAKVDSIDKRLIVVETTLVAVIARLDNLELRVEKLEEKVDNIDKRLAVVETKVSIIETKIDKLDEKVDQIAANQTALNGQFAILIQILSGKIQGFRWIDP